MNKPFDLTKPVQTRDGHSVRLLCTDAGDGEYPVVALVGGSVYRYTLEGAYYRGDRIDPADLVNIPAKHQITGWANCYPDITFVHKTKSEADERRSPRCIACVPITINFEEGAGL